MLFQDLGLIEPLMKALDTEGYTHPTPIQQQAIPVVLQHRDLLGCAQTGTGKTAAFSLPILQILHAERAKKPAGRNMRVLILTPTRELAIQINESLAAYGRNTGVRHAVIFGGVGQEPQVQALKRGVDIVVATPGRLLDLMNQGYVHLNELGIFVLDEADRMLDMGFIHDVKKVIAKLPTQRQTLFFSATMPPEIAKLADSILKDPVKVEVTPISSTAELVTQSIYFTDKRDKKNLLEHLLKKPQVKSALVFTRTKHGANRVAADLNKVGIRAEAIHGNKSQTARQSALQNFKNGKLRALVATDIAARGIDIEELSHVINFELPNIPETYVHRIGRTGRAGFSGEAWSLCDAEEIPYLKDIQKLIGKVVPVEREHPYPADLAAPGLPVAGTAKNGKANNNAPAKAKPQPTPPHQPKDVDIVPLPQRRDERPAPPGHQRPSRPQQEARPRPEQRAAQQGQGNNNRPDKTPQGQDRPAQGGQGANRPERSQQRPQQGQARPEQRPNRSEQKPNRPEQRPFDKNQGGRSEQGPKPRPQEKQRPSATEPKSAPSVASFFKNRFASIVEASTLAEPVIRLKPKPKEWEGKGKKK